MAIAHLEHININVTNPKRTAALLCRVFDWVIRWEGPSMEDGHTIHVGTKRQYIALYTNVNFSEDALKATNQRLGLNHIAIEVDSLNKVKTRIENEGYTPHSFQNYAPGARFYFHDDDNIEYEIVCYQKTKTPFHKAMTRQL